MAIDTEDTDVVEPNDPVSNDAHSHDPAGDHDVQVVTPVIVDLGKVRRKHIKRLKKGEGRLVGEVLDVVDEVADVLGDEVSGSSLVPVVLIYERKRKKNRRRTFEFPF